jgi:eukaryotic-like serine/threonine-protein kinase
MGAVFLVRKRGAQSDLALKVMLESQRLDPQHRKRFVREMAHTAAAQHPNVVSVFEAGEFEDVAFYMMEFCRGGSAADHGRLPIEAAATVILQVLDALIFMSGVTALELVDDEPRPFTGLVHRDLKPANILFPVAGSYLTKVADFGFAKAYEAAGLTNVTRQPPFAAGTAPYMPRQQVVEFRAAKPEVDVWAAAASFYRMVTGEWPRKFGPDRKRYISTKSWKPYRYPCGSAMRMSPRR